jgi:hypothetical protein
MEPTEIGLSSISGAFFYFFFWRNKKRKEKSFMKLNLLETKSIDPLAVP